MKLIKGIIAVTALAATALSASSCYIKISGEAKQMLKDRLAASEMIYSEADSVVIRPGEFKGLCNLGFADIDFVVREGEPVVVIKGTHRTRDSVKVNLDNSNGNLVIKMRGPLAFDEHVTVYAPPINVLESHGSGDIMVQGGLRGEYLSLILSGSGDVVIAGCETVGMVSVDKTGSGDLKATVNSGSVAINCAGSGNVVLEGKTGELTLEKSGSGSFYSGNMDAETVNIKKVSGSGEVAYREGGKVSSGTVDETD